MTTIHRRKLEVAVTLLAALSIVASSSGAAPVRPIPAPPATRTFKHVVIIFQENRTPDNLFHGLCLPPYGTATSCSTSPGPKQYDIQTDGWLDKTAASGKTSPHAVSLGVNYDLGHSHGSWVSQCDLDPATKQCKMDGSAGVRCAPHAMGACRTSPQFGYVENTTGTITPYLQLASQYGWANSMFQTNQGPSYPAHQFMFGGSAAPSSSDDAAGIFASENMIGTGGTGGFKVKAGCASPATTRVQLISPAGESAVPPKVAPSPIPSPIYPCFERKTLTDLFAGGVTWRYYAPSPWTIWTAPNSINHICVPNGHTTTSACAGPIWKKHMDFHPPDVVDKDIKNCALRSVSWVIPAGLYSDHAGSDKGTGGPAWVAKIVNAIGTNTTCDGSGYWQDTAIFITWDDWGGWYDHVAPTIASTPQGDYSYGFRVPMVVVSAYTPKGYINNAHHDFGSILRFVERNFGITEGALDFADARSQTDLRAFFTMSAPPRAFVPIPAPTFLPAHRLDHTAPDDG